MNKDNKDMIEEFLSNTEEALDTNTHKKCIIKLIKEITLLENKSSKLVYMRINEKIDENSYEEKYKELSEKTSTAKQKKIELQLQIDDKNPMQKRIKTFRNVFNTETPLEAFDRFIFDSLVDKVIIGEIDAENRNPYVVTFILKTGLTIGGKLKKDVEDNEGQTFSLPQHDMDKACSDSLLHTC